jgi:hypothetical protein
MLCTLCQVSGVQGPRLTLASNALVTMCRLAARPKLGRLQDEQTARLIAPSSGHRKRCPRGCVHA